MATKNELLKFDGMAAVIAKMEKIIENTSGGTQGKKLKRVYVAAAAVVSDQARQNIANLKATPELKEVLTAMVVTNEGPENKSNAISRVAQGAAQKKFPDRFLPNPYWFEYGTVPRRTNKGANRGEIQPQPFFRPAVETARAKATQVLVDGIRKLVDI